MVATTGEILSAAAARFGNRPALLFEAHAFSFLERDRLSNRMANGLAAAGVTAGERGELTFRGPMVMDGYWTNPRSGSRVSRRRRAHDSQCAGCRRVNWIICRSRPIMAKVCAKKLSGESAKREVPDPAAPTHSTASRGLFARWGESS